MKKNGIVGVLALAIGLMVSVIGRAETNEVPAPETDGEIWNRGVDLYRAGNLTNAIAVLKPLILSKTHGARASELVGAMEFACGQKRDGSDSEASLRLMESAAIDFQAALRSNPSDARMNRNYTRAVDRLPELREQAHVEKVLKELGNQDLAGMLGNGVRDARSAMEEFPIALTNDARIAVSKCEAISKRIEKLSDMWIAVKRGVAQSVTNEQQAMTIAAQVDEARAATDAAANALADLDTLAQMNLAKAETSLTRFWKLAILPPAACDEAILSQTNSLIGADTINSRGWQGEALDYMHAFRSKFGQWAQMYAQKAQSDTNMPPFTAEAQAEVEKLANEVVALQEELATEDAQQTKLKPEKRGGGRAADHAAKELSVLEKLNRIRELLPKDKNGGGQGSQGGAQNQNQDKNQQNKDDDKDNDKGQNQEQQDNGQDQEQDKQPQDDGAQDQQKQDGEEKQDKSPEDGQKEQSADDRQVEDMLRKAKERNDQHEADKKARMRNAPLPSNERDW